MGDDDKSNRKGYFRIAVIVIIIIALWLLIPNIPGLIEIEEDNDDSSPQEYDKIDSTDTIVYRNDVLDVKITRNKIEDRENPTYEAQWTNITGNSSSVLSNTPDNLFNEILQVQEDLTSDQIIWFDYMLEKVVK
jgi:hypothetical protein